MAHAISYASAPIYDADSDKDIFETIVVPDDTANWTFVDDANGSNEMISKSECLPSPIDFVKQSAIHIWSKPNWSKLSLAAATAGLIAAKQVKGSLNDGALAKLLDASEKIVVTVGKAGAQMVGHETRTAPENEKNNGALSPSRKPILISDHQKLPHLEKLGKSDEELQLELFSAANQTLGKELEVGGVTVDAGCEDYEFGALDKERKGGGGLLADSGTWTTTVEPGSKQAEMRERCRAIWDNEEEGWSRA